MSKSSPEQKGAKNDKLKQELKSWAIVILIALGLKSTIVASYMVPTGSMENTIMTGDFLIGNKFIYGTMTPDWLGIPYTRIGFQIPHFRLPSFRVPKQGDVVIFKFPLDKHLQYVKRCVAGPGQTLEIRDKQLYVDEQPYPLPEHGKFVRSRVYSPKISEPGIFSNKSDNSDNFGPLYVPQKGDTLYLDDTPAYVIRNVAELANHSFDIRLGKMYINDQQRDYYVVEQDHYFMIGDNRDNSYDSRYWGFVSHNLVVGKALVVFLSWNKHIPLYRLTEKIRWIRFGKVLK